MNPECINCEHYKYIKQFLFKCLAKGVDNGKIDSSEKCCDYEPDKRIGVLTKIILLTKHDEL